MFLRPSFFCLAALVFLVSTPLALALPIDWGGSLGFDTTLLSNIRRTGDSVTKTPGTNNGTQGIANGSNGANFQTYIFKLNPSMIINDSVTMKGELSTGYLRGGFLGDNTKSNQDGSGGNSYYNSTPAQRTGLNVNQLYAEIYADTALIKVGRFARHYGLGAVINGGNKTWDRFFTLYDGIQAEVRIGNFVLTPHWARISNYSNNANNNTTATPGAQPNGKADVREVGITAAYDNKTNNLYASLTYSKRQSEAENSLYQSSADATPPGNNFARGKTSVTLIDAYLEKKWQKTRFAIEIPLLSGEYGHVYDASTKSKISSNSIITEFVWNASSRWDFGLNAGQVGGDKGSSNKFEATYLHPNYQIAELMFRYNYAAFNEGSKSVFDSGIANARYAKVYGNYKTDRWTWKAAFIFANAMEAAKSGRQAYHHEENYRFNSTQNQSNKLGYELDLGFDFLWNPNMTLSGFIAYWGVGDYYSFTNTSTKLGTKNVLGSGLRLGIDF